MEITSLIGEEFLARFMDSNTRTSKLLDSFLLKEFQQHMQFLRTIMIEDKKSVLGTIYSLCICPSFSAYCFKTMINYFLCSMYVVQDGKFYTEAVNLSNQRTSSQHNRRYALEDCRGTHQSKPTRTYWEAQGKRVALA